MIPRPPRCSTRSGLILADWITLSAIVVVVLVVSFPRLHSLALRQNERDAMQAIQLLGHSVLAQDRDMTLSELLADDSDLEHHLDDIEMIENGRLLRRHGYLFDLTRDEKGSCQVRAWPWRCGETGLGAFVFTKGKGLQGHPNGKSLWSGPEGAPTWTASDQNWRSVED